jgi:hypothetical protein
VRSHLVVIASEAKQSMAPLGKYGLLRRFAPLHKRFAFVAGNDGGETYLIGGAYWIPPLLQSEFSPRGIFSFDPSPTLRS